MRIGNPEAIVTRTHKNYLKFQPDLSSKPAKILSSISASASRFIIFKQTQLCSSWLYFLILSLASQSQRSRSCSFLKAVSGNLSFKIRQVRIVNPTIKVRLRECRTAVVYCQSKIGGHTTIESQTMPNDSLSKRL